MKYMEYTRFDKPIMALLLTPYALATCYVIYGSGYFSEARVFWLGTLAVLAFLFLQYQIMKTIALGPSKKVPGAQSHACEDPSGARDFPALYSLHDGRILQGAEQLSFFRKRMAFRKRLVAGGGGV
jgi:hypothetical protein